MLLSSITKVFATRYPSCCSTDLQRRTKCALRLNTGMTTVTGKTGRFTGYAALTEDQRARIADIPDPVRRVDARLGRARGVAAWLDHSATRHRVVGGAASSVAEDAEGRSRSRPRAPAPARSRRCAVGSGSSDRPGTSASLDDLDAVIGQRLQRREGVQLPEQGPLHVLGRSGSSPGVDHRSRLFELCRV